MIKKILSYTLLLALLVPFKFSSATVSPVLGASLSSDSDEPSLHVGGALRFNLLLQNYESDITPNSGTFTLDTWRLNAVYNNPGGIGMNFEYRFYPTFNTHFIKQAWLQYDFSPQTQAQLGVTQVPFGNLQYNSNNWWFSLNYYVGLEDDHDMGIKFTHRTDSWQWDFAYFFQPEPAGPANGEAAFNFGGSGRYSYDVIPDGDLSLQERNQFNVRGAYQLPNGEVGASVQFGQLYNEVLDEFDTRYALAAHANLNYGNFNVKPQLTYYNMNATDDFGNTSPVVRMGAYGSPYDVATDALIATLGLAYSYDVDWGPVTNLLFYNDFSYMEKYLDEDFDAEHVIQNITGVLLSAGPVFTYFDIAQGYNHPWLTDDFGVGLGPGHGDLGGEAEYNIRFNINIGFYF
ncbi:hypothetical protein CYPRO_0960 [Cyclonatronum proteinivorum]|uniref:Phosphate-selective porin O and P n=1 Tax=Cyclonatronum proteinivorum TaxID=1457365 RepID=A0A345UID5_9BACT|nr:hypothetical protein [Cyclonatronum proteinivorum]AXJ00237.1 hypothetical protein CYPRO_0960 [Cyclonatronum proteinivorum]